MLKSMSLKQFLITIEKYAVKDGVEDLAFADKFLELVEEEKSLVSCHSDINEISSWIKL